MIKGPGWSSSNQVSNLNEQEVTDPRQAKYDSYLSKGQAGIQVFFEPCKGQLFETRTKLLFEKSRGRGLRWAGRPFTSWVGLLGRTSLFIPGHRDDSPRRLKSIISKQIKAIKVTSS